MILQIDNSRSSELVFEMDVQYSKLLTIQENQYEKGSIWVELDSSQPLKSGARNFLCALLTPNQVDDLIDSLTEMRRLLKEKHA
jgi:hypothetical protein